MTRSRLAAWFESLGESWSGASGPAVALALLLLLVPLAVGGVHPSTQVAAAAVAVVGLVWSWIRQARGGGALHLELFGSAFALVLVWSTLQWLPLPRGLVEALVPGTVQVREASAAALDHPVAAWIPLTLDASRTGQAWLTIAGYFAAFLTATELARRRHRRLLVSLLEASAVVVLVVSALHAALGAEAIYGVYQPSVPIERLGFASPFVNPNHAGALYMLVALVAFGTWLERRTEAGALRHLVVAAMLAIGVVATASRANIVLLGGGVLALGVVAVVRDPDATARKHALRGLGGLVLIAAVATIALLAASPEWAEGFSADTIVGHELRQRWDVGFGVARDHLWFGAGVGAFPVAAASLIPDWTNGMMDQAHNAVLQAVADWGLPVVVVAFGLAVAGFARATWSGRKRLGVIGLAVALVALVLQNMVDFSFWIPGVGYAASVVAGTLIGYGLSRRRSGGDVPARSRTLLMGAAGVVSLGVLVFIVGQHTLSQGPARWQAAAEAAIDAGKPGRVQLEALIDEHPADFHLVRLAGRIAAIDGRAEEARKLLTRATELAPTHEGVLLDRALVALASKDVDEALRWLERAASANHRGREGAAALVLRYMALPGLAEAFAGQGVDRALSLARRLLEKGRRRQAMIIYEAALKAHPDSVRLYESYAQLLGRLPGQEQRLDRLSLAILSRGAQAEDRTDGERWLRVGYLAQGELMRRQGRLREAWHLLEEARRLSSEATAPSVLVAQGDVLVAMGDADRLSELVNTLEPAARRDPIIRGHRHRLNSYLLELGGELRDALREAQRAALFLKGDVAVARREKELYAALAARRAGDGPTASTGP